MRREHGTWREVDLGDGLASASEDGPGAGVGAQDGADVERVRYDGVEVVDEVGGGEQVVGVEARDGVLDGGGFGWVDVFGGGCADGG